MSKKAKAKSKKVNSLKVSPLIIVIALVEVIVLIGVVTLAWFRLAENNSVFSGDITVAPDSGLKIDFAHTGDDHINLRNYLENFEFEPATSVDGRNIYFPTSGTFNNTETNNIKFREGTVNDVNSKYISVDFTLTNDQSALPAAEQTTAKVYLDSASKFEVKNGTNNKPTGRALRIAFYQNDNKSGKVASPELIKNSQGTKCTVYFNDNLGWVAGGRKPYIYLWKSSDTSQKLAAFPGNEMKRISGDQYYFSFDNATGYDKVIFSNGVTDGNKTQTEDLDLHSGYIYTPTSSTTTNSKNQTVYVTDSRQYSDLASNSGYAVIAPGVSAGFRRAYAPVAEINNTVGNPTTIVPSFASSIDEYYTVDSPLFEIPPNETQYLSMIIWLEGTDENCDEDTYAGDKIDLDLIFATAHGGADPSKMTTVHFYDRTKENWIDNDLTDDYGITFNPVIQLYDVVDERGYLMELASGSTTDWVADVPSDIFTSRHGIEFRRVNPADETEKWNFWDASEIKPYDIRNSTNVTVASTSTSTYEGVQKEHYTYYFTAFADGGPDKAMMTANGKDAENVLDYSCGGLWGDHATTQFIYVDGTQNMGIKSNSGILTMRFTYKYDNDSNHDQTIEYKASPQCGSQFYYFRIPMSILNTAENTANYKSGSASDFSFVRYTGFNGSFALNVDFRNPNVTYSTTYSLSNSVLEGRYACTAGTNGSTTYLGYDILYFRVACNTNSGNNNLASGANFQVHYFGTAGDYDTNLYSKVADDNLKTNDFDTYASVIPLGRTGYLLYRMSTNYISKYGQTDSNSGYNYIDNVLAAYQYNGDNMRYNYQQSSNSFPGERRRNNVGEGLGDNY